MLQKLLILIIILFNFLHYISSSQAAKCHPDDEAGLLSFKSGIISDPSGLLNTWIPGTDCCSTWEGITCEEQPLNRVITFAVVGDPNNSTQILSGTISPALSKLQYLTSINLFNLRSLSGPFPTFLFNLPRLNTVSLGKNNLSGILPTDIGTRFPSQMGFFEVEGNRFSGPIPSSIGQWTQLNRLTLGGNMFTGSIPYSIGNINNLFSLSLDGNQLTGTIPASFKGLTKLAFVNVSNNNLSGNIPEFLPALNSLDLSWNRFNGIVPKSFANLTGLFYLDLSHNSLVDPFPELKIDRLQTIDLSYNHFRLGEIPPWVTSLPEMYSLKLVKCGIKIKLDDWKPVLTSFYNTVDLSENEIIGSPVQILNRTPNLVSFYASGNQLKFNLGSLKIAPTLKYLDLSRNLVFGMVPKAVTGLEKLNVSNNHLCGQLPKTKFSASAFLGNDCLCGSPLPKCKV